MAQDSVKKIQSGQSENDIYTALLGLTILILSATAVWVCLRSLDFFGSIFSLAK